MGKFMKVTHNLYTDNTFATLITSIPNCYMGIAVGNTSTFTRANIKNNYTFFTDKLSSESEIAVLGGTFYYNPQITIKPAKLPHLWFPLCAEQAVNNVPTDPNSYCVEIVFSNGYKIRDMGNNHLYLYDSNNTLLNDISWDRHLYMPRLSSDGNPLYSVVTVSNMNNDGTIPSDASMIQWLLNGVFSVDDMWGFGYAASTTNKTALINFFNAVPSYVIPTDPYADIDGESDLIGDTVAIPGDPALSVTSTGIVGLFSPTSQQMQDLADFMWTDFGGTGTTVEDILGEIVQALKRSISNPLDYVIGLNIIPSQGLSKGASKVIRFGFMSSGVSMPELNSQFFTVDCGSISFDYLCGNTFLDYAPYSKFSIYLPYIGVKEVDANDFVGHTIGVKYKGDVVTGGLTAFITKDGSVMYQYSGSCALNIPLTADNWGSTISAAINVATAVIGAASMPGAGLAASAAKASKAAVGATVSNVAANPSLLSPQVARSGAISGGAGAIGVQHPYVIREAVRFHSTASFNTLTGYPSYYFRSLADMTGYTVVYDCHLENIPATDGEIREIEQLLEGGVIL